MFFLFISIIANVSASALFLLMKSRKLALPAVVFINYVTGIILISLFFRPQFSSFDGYLSVWWLFVLLGILLPSIFLLLARSVQSVGIARTDAAMRLSLFLAILAAIFIFHEAVNPLKISAIFLALLSVMFLVKPEKGNFRYKRYSLYLLLVFLGYAACDVLFKLISKVGLAFTNYLIVSFVLAALIMGIYLWFNKITINKLSCLFGVILGILNFTNIYTYIMAHQTMPNKAVLVFTTMNIGVIVLSLLIGVFIAKERISRWHLSGIALAIIAIILLMYSY